MSNRVTHGNESVEWPLVYLSVTAISIALVVGVEYAQTRPAPMLELLVGVVVVSMYTVTSVLYWYDVSGKTRSRDFFTADEWVGESNVTETVEPEHVRENHD